MFNHHLTASEALPIMLAAFERYKEDPQPSSALKETVESLEQELQCKVRKSEAGNIALYTKLGFTITTEELYTNLNGEVMAIVSMEKIIQ